MTNSATVDLLGVRREAMTVARLAGLRDGALCDEVAQEVMVRWWRSGVIDMEARTRAAWVRTTTRRCVLDALRGSMRRAGDAVECDALPGDGAAGLTEARIGARQELAAIDARVRAMPPSLRVVFEAVVFEGRAIEDVARTLAVSRAAVDTRLRRMRMRLAA